MHFLSPAKLNLFLQILGRREDDFHEIVTRYQAIAFGDQLSLSISSRDSFQIINDCQLEISNNSIWKSTALFRQYTGITDPVSWRVVKHIPIGSGLAGGSSNAATALFALNQMFQTGLSDEELRSLAEKVGMDTPFFFSSGSALGLGRGEKVVTLNELVVDRYILYFSNKGVLTSEAFAVVKPSDCSLSKDLEYARNDLENPVFRLRLDLKEKKRWLEDLWKGIPVYVGLTGSGATLFVRYPKALEKNSAYATQIQKIIALSGGVSTSPIQRDTPNWYPTILEA
ncbi:4-(cytidine 5'-diphospho)-2-C-methyl-D-erythritol kinase [Chlamydia trachomatis]|nr:4-(cytidine 5'-diphospho)-2-C-methyl-D-erythritol kinase [Chlamydia trachomatis]